MKIVLADQLGFCNGVKAAIEIATALKQKYRNVYTLGNLIHNEKAVEELNESGIKSINLEQALLLKQDEILVLKAHGTPEEITLKLKENKINYVDGICNVVNRIHKLIDAVEPNRNIYIFGNKKHDEVIALASHANNKIRQVAVIENPEEIDFTAKSAVFFQTTIKKNFFENIKKYIDEKNQSNNNFVVYYNTICYNTIARQNEAARMAGETEYCLVLGSKNSANTNTLFSETLKNNSKTFFIQRIEDVEKINFNNSSVSILSGASTPASLIQEVVVYMSEITENQENVKNEISMEEIANSLDASKEKVGSIVKCIVVKSDELGLVVNDLKSKSEVKILKEDIGDDYNPSQYKPKQEIEAVYLGRQGNKNKYSIKELKLQEEARKQIASALENGIFKCQFTKWDDKNFYGTLGKGNWAYKVIAPIQEVMYSKKQTQPARFLKKTFELKAIPNPNPETNTGKNVIFASLKEIIMEKRAKEDAMFVEKINVDDVLNGKVVGTQDRGILVDFDGHIAFVHASQLAWKHLDAKEIEKMFKVGEKFDFLVLEINRATNKVVIGHKELTDKPIEAAKKKYNVGDIVKAQVKKIFDYGVLVSFDTDLTGLIHISQLANKHVKDPSEIVKVGQKIDVKILNFDDDRIQLSYKSVVADTEQSEDNSDTNKSEKKSNKAAEQSEWRSEGQASATIGELFKDLDTEKK